MRLKSFYAKTTTEAMQMVRDTLGEDAVIVATREERSGDGARAGVRVTAAIDHNDPFENGFEEDRDFANDWVNGDGVDDESIILERLTDAMLRHSVPEEVTDQVISCATVVGMQDAHDALVAALEHLFSFRPMPTKPTGGTAYMMVGAPGSGKTLAVAKLAARAVMNDMRVGVISTDTIRAGGIQQLSAFTKLMNVELKTASNAQQLRGALDHFRHADQIFIDTGGVNPFDPEEMRIIARLISAGDIEPVLALPAGTDADESGEIARVYATLGVNTMIPTRVDIARRLGGLLSAAHYGGLIFADAGNTPKVADGLTALSPEKLAGMLMPESVKKSAKTPVTARRKEMVHAG